MEINLLCNLRHLYLITKNIAEYVGNTTIQISIMTVFLSSKCSPFPYFVGQNPITGPFQVDSKKSRNLEHDTLDYYILSKESFRTNTYYVSLYLADWGCNLIVLVLKRTS